MLRRLADAGHSIVFISHKLYEVLEIADRITVIRRGRVVGQRVPTETDEDDLAELMVGRDVQLIADRGESHPGESDAPGRRPCRSTTTAATRSSEGVDLEIRAGEILGIAGVAGNGQDELVEALVGLRKAPAGAVRLELAGDDPRKSADGTMNEAGVALCARRPAPLRTGAVVPGRGQRRPDRLLPTSLSPAAFVRDDDAIDDAAREGIEEYDIRTPSATVSARRAVGRQPAEGRGRAGVRPRSPPAILDQPTRGLDVGSIEFIHRQADRETRCRDRHPARLGRARRGPGAVRSDRRDVPRRDRRRPRRAHRGQERGRPAHGDRRSRPAGHDRRWRPAA